MIGQILPNNNERSYTYVIHVRIPIKADEYMHSASLITGAAL
jgi:hypothetical protein